jgi:hypothetical protein
MKTIGRIVVSSIIILIGGSIMMENFWMGILVGFLLGLGFFFADILKESE